MVQNCYCVCRHHIQSVSSPGRTLLTWDVLFICSVSTGAIHHLLVSVHAAPADHAHPAQVTLRPNPLLPSATKALPTKLPGPPSIQQSPLHLRPLPGRRPDTL